MTNIEVQAIIDEISSNGKKISSSKKSSRSFLIELGVLTESGEVAQAYNDLCIRIFNEAKQDI